MAVSATRSRPGSESGFKLAQRKHLRRVVTPAIPIEGISAKANQLLGVERAESTRIEYDRAFDRYMAWRHSYDGGDHMDASPHALAEYVNTLFRAKKSPSTIGVAVAGVRYRHIIAGRPIHDPDKIVDRAMKGATRKLGKKATNPSLPLTIDLLSEIIPPVSDRITNLARRNAAIVLLGYFGALRRSEIAGLKISDLTIVEPDGMRITLGQSKADQEGKGDHVDVFHRPEVDICPLVAIRAWLDVRSMSEDYVKSGRLARHLPLFTAISCKDVIGKSDIGHRTIARVFGGFVGPQPADGPRLSAHSMRSGLLTEASAVASLPELMRHARHKNPSTTMAYIRPEASWDNNVTAKLARKAASKSDPGHS